MITTVHHSRRGFLLFEMILALAVFSIAATAFAVALKRMANVAALAQSELRITRILDGALNETLFIPVLEEGVTTSEVGQTGIELETTIKLMDDLENDEGLKLQNMYSITVVAKWYENGAWNDRTVDTWRYGSMYQLP